MRKYITKKEDQFLHTPTYQFDNLTKFEKQCYTMHKYLEKYIREQMEVGITLIMEGIHLNHDFNKKMI